MDTTFPTPEPVTLDLVVEFGQVELTALPGTQETHVSITGDEEYAEAFTVELRGSVLEVHAPGRGPGSPRPGIGLDINLGPFRFSRGPRVRVEVAVPAESTLRVVNASADVRAEGSWGDVRATAGSGDLWLPQVVSAHVESGSGDVGVDRVEKDAHVRTRSGDMTIGSVGGALQAGAGSGDIKVDGPVGGAANVQTGSGDIDLDQVAGLLTATTGSGDVNVACAHSGALLRAASGEIAVRRVEGDVQASTASGEVHLGRVGAGECTVRTASGDVRVGVAPLTPVWTDVRSLSGDIENAITSVGEPEPGEPTIRLHVQSASGDISLATARG